MACSGESNGPPLAVTTVIRRADTVQFDLPLTLYRCDGSADVLVQGIRSGDGVLLWLRPQDSLGGSLPIVGSRDTITRPASIVAIRYYRDAQVHSFALDSGSVTVVDRGESRRIVVSGSGMQQNLGARSRVNIEMATLPAPAESTLSCAPVP